MSEGQTLEHVPPGRGSGSDPRPWPFGL